MDDEIPLQGGSHASSSHKASLESITKRREDLGEHNVHIHFIQDRNARLASGPKLLGFRAEDAKGEAMLRADNFGDLITADHKVLSDNCESRNNHRFAVVVQPHNGSRRIRAKTKLHKKPSAACKSSWSPRGNQKSFTLTTPQNSEKLVKIFHGIIARLPTPIGD